MAEDNFDIIDQPLILSVMTAGSESTATYMPLSTLCRFESDHEMSLMSDGSSENDPDRYPRLQVNPIVYITLTMLS